MGKIEEFTVEQLARKVGLSRHGIRFYIQRGLLPPPEFHGAASVP